MLRVVGQDGHEIYFKVKPHTKMEKLMSAYAQRAGTDDFRGYRFVFNGERVQPEDTAKSLEMENDDCIDVMVEQTGG